MDLSKEIQIAVEAARVSGKLLLDEREKLNITSSSDTKDVKLEADIASENAIKETIKDKSNFEILAEESGKSSENLGATYWVIDPLDGTANYSRDIPICCVSIGMIKDKNPIFGVIYDFNNDDLYIGDCVNVSAKLNDQPITVSHKTTKEDGVLITGLPFNTDYSDQALENLVKDMQAWKKTRMIGSAAMASCYVASGKAELYKENGIYLWDIIAGAAIVESAGGHAEINNIRDNFQVDVVFSNAKIKG